MQMALAAGFALLKLLNSDFAGRLPSEGRQYVLQTIEALRKSKVETNDLLDRFAEVLAQLWKESSRGRSLHSMSQSPVVSNPGIANMFNNNVQAPTPKGQQNSTQRRESTGKLKLLHQCKAVALIINLGMLEDPLGLIVRSRMSMSVVFDCVWRWRESQVSGASAAEQLDMTVRENPTNPDSSSNSTPPPGIAIENPAHTLPNFNPHLNTLSMPLQLTNGLASAASANPYEFFDSVSWMLEAQDWSNQYSGGPYSNEFGS